VVQFPNAGNADEFCFTTANNNIDRDPVQWKLEASLTGAEWTPLHVQSFRYDTPKERQAQTAWFPFDTANIEQERPATRAPGLARGPCVVTRAAFDARLRGAACMSWPEFCAVATAATDPSPNPPAILDVAIWLAALLLNLIIWCLLTMLGTHHSPWVGLVAALAYGFLLRALVAHCLEPDLQLQCDSTLDLHALVLMMCGRRRKTIKVD